MTYTIPPFPYLPSSNEERIRWIAWAVEFAKQNRDVLAKEQA